MLSYFIFSNNNIISIELKIKEKEKEYNKLIINKDELDQDISQIKHEIDIILKMLEKFNNEKANEELEEARKMKDEEKRKKLKKNGRKNIAT